MKRITLSLVVFITGLALAVPAQVFANGDSAPAGAEGGHTVVKGDTLWDISGAYLEDPLMWPEVWKANPGIKNPDLIYPGERVVIPGMPAKAAGAKDVLPEKKAPLAAKKPMEKSPFEEEPFVDISETLLVVPEKEDKKVISLDETRKQRVPVATQGAILEAGFISDDTGESMTIAGSPLGERSVFTVGDEVYLFARPDTAPGDLLVTFRPEAEVEHPATGDDMGMLVKVTGLMKVIGPRDGFMLCKVESIVNDIRNTDLVMPYTVPELVYEPIKKDPGLKGEWGYVVASLDARQLNATLYTVYLDLGSDDGVKPGDTFEVRRSGGTVAYDDPEHYYLVDKELGLPDVVVGEVQVISVTDRTSAAKVATFSEPVRPGHRVYYKD